MGTQFQNAFSDNALKNLVIFLALAQPSSEGERSIHVAMIGALFAAPFILFSMLGGWLADRFSKQRVMSQVKLCEIAIMILATAGLALNNLPIQFSAVFLMGCHSAIFAPSKYSILPEILPLQKLSWGNGILELLTFLGIILGTVAGGFLAAHFKQNIPYAGVVLVIFAIIGWAMCQTIPRGSPPNPTCVFQINPVSALWAQVQVMKHDSVLWRANIGNTGFFFLAALAQMNLVLYGQGVLLFNESQVGLLNAALAIGIGTGSIAAGYTSKGRINRRLILIGALVMGIASIFMGIKGIPSSIFFASLGALGFGGGFFIVPVTAVLQHNPAAENKGAVQGAASVLSFIGILSASGVQIVLTKIFQMEIHRMFWICGISAIAAGVYASGGTLLPNQDEG